MLHLHTFRRANNNPSSWPSIDFSSHSRKWRNKRDGKEIEDLDLCHRKPSPLSCGFCVFRPSSRARSHDSRGVRSSCVWSLAVCVCVCVKIAQAREDATSTTMTTAVNCHVPSSSRHLRAASHPKTNRPSSSALKPDAERPHLVVRCSLAISPHLDLLFCSLALCQRLRIAAPNWKML